MFEEVERLGCFRHVLTAVRRNRQHAAACGRETGGIAFFVGKY
ncbi:hypothetical protein [Paenibacillus ferrarius]